MTLQSKGPHDGTKGVFMHRFLSARDIVWLMVFLGCVLYFLVIDLSGCQWDRGPFHFVRGCHNYGIDWNSFMAPIGFVVILALPCSIVYWLMRAFQAAFHLARYILRR